MTKRVFEIDGNAFDDLEGFFDEVQRRLLTAPWGRNLDAFNDVVGIIRTHGPGGEEAGDGVDLELS